VLEGNNAGYLAPLSPLDSRADSSSTIEGSNLLALRACSAYPIFSPAGWAEGPSNPPATKRARDLQKEAVAISCSQRAPVFRKLSSRNTH